MNPYSTASLYNPEELTFQKPMGIDEGLKETSAPKEEPMFNKEMGRTAASSMSSGAII